MHTAGVRLSLVLAGALVLTACGGRKPPEPPAPEESAPPSSSTPVSTAGDGGSSSTMRADDAAARAALAEPIYFGFDRADLTAAARTTLDRKAEVLRRGAGVRLVVAGHTDERGSTEYNLALGMRRAAEARRYLVGRGIAEGSLEVMSFGEERPADSGHGERAWAANRRAEFDLTAGTLAASD